MRDGIQLSEAITGDGAAIFRHACLVDFEGIVSKRIGSRNVIWRRALNDAAARHPCSKIRSNSNLWRLSRVQASACTAEEQSAVTPASPVVLLIDRDDNIRNALAEYLRECGYGVIEAQDAKQARAALKMSEPKVDVALVDAATTGSGYALRNWIMSRHPDVEVILAGTTENTVRGAGEVCKDGPAINKPYDHSQVLDRIRHSLAGRSNWS